MKFQQIVALATLISTALGSGALAQDAQPTANTLPTKPEKFKDWDLICPPPKEANGRRVCEIRTVILSDKGQKLGALVVAAIAGDPRGEVIASALLPLGVDLTSEPTLEVEGKPMRLKYLRCLQRGCEALTALSEGQQAALRAGSIAKVGVGVGGGKTATFQFSLSGFSAAHDALKKRVAAR